MNNYDDNRGSTPRRSFLHARNGRATVGWIIGGLVFLLFAGLLLSIFVFPHFYGIPTGPYTYYPLFFFPFGALLFLFFVFIVVRGVSWGWGWRGGYSGGYGHHWGYYGDATEILKQRYARGEITKDQFDQMMKDLKSQDA